MAASRDLPAERLAIGQLLVRLLREFRDDLAAPRADAGYGDVRETHFQVFGNIRMGGIRLTELADRAQLSLAATSQDWSGWTEPRKNLLRYDQYYSFCVRLVA